MSSALAGQGSVLRIFSHSPVVVNDESAVRMLLLRGLGARHVEGLEWVVICRDLCFASVFHHGLVLGFLLSFILLWVTCASNC